MIHDNLVVKPASDAQAYEVVARMMAHWGAKAGISNEDYIKMNAIFQTGEYAQDGRLKSWVLVPDNDTETIDFFASCQIYTRQVLVLYPGHTTPLGDSGHAVAGVITPPHHRGKGYGKRLMSLLHVALAPHRYPDLKNSVISENSSSLVSVLYSSVGSFYSKCRPYPEESGWTAQKSTKTVWDLTSIQGELTNQVVATTPISDGEVGAALNADDTNIAGDLLQLQKSDPTKTYFAFVPTAPANAVSLMFSKLTPGCPVGAPWGARVSGGDEFVTWVYEARASRKLVITRLRSKPESFPALFRAALLAAKEAKCELIEVWNLPQDLVGLVPGAETTERQDLLSAFKWYGKKDEPETGVVWAVEERYSWC